MAGLLQAKELEERPKQLRSLNRGIEVLMTEVGYLATPVPLALKTVGRCTRGPVAQLWFRAAEETAHGRSLSFAAMWQRTLSDITPHLALTSEDRQELESLGSFLGRSDRMDQMAKLKALSTRLSTLEDQARARKERLCRLYQYLGWAVGLGLCLFLM